MVSAINLAIALQHLKGLMHWRITIYKHDFLCPTTPFVGEHIRPLQW